MRGRDPRIPFVATKEDNPVNPGHDEHGMGKEVFIGLRAASLCATTKLSKPYGLRNPFETRKEILPVNTKSIEANSQVRL